MSEYYYFISMVMLCLFYTIFYKQYITIKKLEHYNNTPYYVLKKYNIN